MSKRHDSIVKYAGDIEKKCEMKADMKLLTAVNIGCGPSIYSAGACTVSASDPNQLDRVKGELLNQKTRLERPFKVR